MYESQHEKEWAFIARDAGCKLLFVGSRAIHDKVAAAGARSMPVVAAGWCCWTRPPTAADDIPATPAGRAWPRQPVAGAPPVAGRHRLPAVHLGHHRRSQGRGADARQHRVQPVGPVPGHPAGHRAPDAVVPALGPRLRPHRRAAHDHRLRRLDRHRRERGQAGGQLHRGAAHRAGGGAPGVPEDLRRGGEADGGQARRCCGRCIGGAWRWRCNGSAGGEQRRLGLLVGAAAVAGRPAGVRQDPGTLRRAAAVRGVGRGGAGPRGGRVHGGAGHRRSTRATA